MCQPSDSDGVADLARNCHSAVAMRRLVGSAAATCVGVAGVGGLRSVKIAARMASIESAGVASDVQLTLISAHRGALGAA